MDEWAFAKIAEDNYRKTQEEALEAERVRRNKLVAFKLKMIVCICIAIIQSLISYILFTHRRGY